MKRVITLCVLSMVLLSGCSDPTGMERINFNTTLICRNSHLYVQTVCGPRRLAIVPLLDDGKTIQCRIMKDGSIKYDRSKVRSLMRSLR